MKKRATLDVIIVTKDRPEKLFRAVNSVLANNDSPTTIIIVDGSQKKSFPFRMYLASLCKKNKVDFIYKSIKKPSISLQRNIGISLTTSDFFVFLDDDEVPPLDWVEKIKKVFLDKQKMVITGYRKAYYPENFWNTLWEHILTFERTNRGYRDFMISSNTAYRTSFIRKYNLLFDNRIKIASDDVLMSYKILETGHKIYVEPNIFIYHDFRINSYSFFKQWYGYGYSTFQAHYYHLTNEQLNLKSFFTIFSSYKNSMLWATQFPEKKVFLFFILSIRDLFFTVGYIVGLCKIAF